MDGFTIYIIGYAISVALSIGWQFAYFDAKYKATDWEEHLGFSIMWSALCMVGWPVMLPMSFCTTGFAKHGWRITHRQVG